MTLLLESAVRTLVIALAAAALLRVFRVRRPATQLVAWTLVLVAALAMPVLLRVAPTWRVPVTAPVVDRFLTAPAPQTTSAVAFTWSTISLPSDVTVPLTPPATTSSVASWTEIAVVLYALGVLLLVVQAVVGWIVSRRLERTSRVIDDDGLVARAAEHARSAGLARAPRLAESERVFVPLAMSVIRPTIVLPADWRAWPHERLDAVLAHEIAHVAGRDTLTQRASLLHRAVFWASPFSWWLHGRLVRLAEHARDEAALARGIAPTTYAETLMSFFADRRGGVARRAAWHVTMARGSDREAERRIDRVLAWEAPPRPRPRVWLIGALAISGPVALLCASVQLVASPVAPSEPSAPALNAPAQPTATAPATPLVTRTQPLDAPSSQALVPPPPAEKTSSSEDARMAEPAQSAPKQTVDLELIPHQANSPITLTSAEAVAGAVGSFKIGIHNDGARGVKTIYFLAMEGPADVDAFPVSKVSVVTVTTPIPKDATQIVDLPNIAPAEHFAALGTNALKAKLGITRVVFDDGTSWGAGVTEVARIQVIPIPLAGGTTRVPADPMPLPQSSPFGAGAYRPGNGLQNPVPIKIPDPKYTSDAMKAKIEGGVELDVVVNANGTVGDVRITKSLDTIYGLDDEAIRTAKSWLFRPGTLNGKPVPMLVSLTVEFRLHPGGLPKVYEANTPGLTAPTIARPADPKYTSDAMRAKIQGDVKVSLVVREDGSVDDLRIVESLDKLYGLDEEALRVVRAYRFTPGMFNGARVPVRIELTISFRLH